MKTLFIAITLSIFFVVFLLGAGGYGKEQKQSFVWAKYAACSVENRKVDRPIF